MDSTESEDGRFPNQDGDETPSWAVRSVVGFAAFALIGGGVTLAGWFTGKPRLTDWMATGISMFPNTAFAAMVAGAALVFAIPRRRWCVRLSGALGLALLLVGGATLFQHLSGVDLGIDTMLHRPAWGERAAAAPGRMGPPASTAFTLIGLALILAAYGRRRARRIVPILGIGVSAVTMLSLMGYLSGADPLFAVARFTGIALQTAGMLLALGLGLIVSAPEYEPLRTLRRHSAAGLLARRSLPFIIGLPVLLGLLRIHGQRAGWFDTAMGTSLLVLLVIAIFGALLWWWVSTVARHEAALRESEARLRRRASELETIFDTSPIGMAIAEDPQGLHIRGNPANERLLGVPPGGEFSRRGSRAGFRVLREGREVPVDALPMQRACRGDAVDGDILDVARADGTTVTLYCSAAPLLDERGAPRGAVGAFLDLTPLQRAEAAMRESEVRYRTLFEVALHGVITIDEAGVIDSVNPAAERLFGYSQAELVGRDVSLLMPEPYKSEHATYLENYRRTGERKIIGIGREVTGLRKDGSRFPIDLAVCEFQLGGRRRFKGIISDITERKRAEAALRESEARERAARGEAEQASRVKDEFLATLSHELRTPLNAIVGWTEWVGRNPADVKTVTEGIQVIKRNARVQADLIADLLDMSRIISGKLRLEVEDVDVAAVVKAAMDAISHGAEAKGIRLEHVLGPVAGTIRGDPSRLQQVIWNLLSNAVKFTPEGGLIQVALAGTASGAEIVVRDTGAGIKADFLPHLFERFRQADASAARQHGGLGLGLAIVKHLVELHGGTVRAESPGEGAGATFTVHLPRAVAQEEVPDVPGGRGPEAAGAGDRGEVKLDGIRVLAIDDHEDTRALLRRVLEEAHAEVVLASSADEGLRAVRDQRPHVVLCDLGMPGKDGFDFITEMRKEGHGAPAVAVTAFARPEDKLAVMQAGYQGYVSKPFDAARLIATVASLAGTPALEREGR